MLRKSVALVFVITLVLVLSCGCAKLFATLPVSQPGTTWSTDDGKVYFYVGEKQSDPIYGYIETQGGPVEIILVMSKQVSLIGIEYVNRTSELCNDAEKKVETWHYSEYTDDSIVITVFESNYFDVGQVLVFHRR